jgi:hypothetical protein
MPSPFWTGIKNPFCLKARFPLQPCSIEDVSFKAAVLMHRIAAAVNVLRPEIPKKSNGLHVSIL